MSFSTAVRDSLTMTRRNLRHTLAPGFLVGVLVVPILMLLLLVYVFGGAFAVGVDYVDYVGPGAILMGVTYGAGITATVLASDMSTGIVDRFRVMAISRASVLTGHVLGTLIRTMVCTVVLVAATVLMGFRPTASPVGWMVVVGFLAVLVVAVNWLMVAIGLAARTAEAAQVHSVPVVFLPFVSSAFVPTHAMSAPVRWFADHQPFTPVIETLRGLLTDAPVGGSAVLAVGWCLVIGGTGYAWAMRLFNRDPGR